MTWKKFITELIVNYCNKRENRTFTLQEFQNDNKKAISSFSSAARTPFNTLRRVLQELRDENFITFVNNSGTYTLRGLDLLDAERKETMSIDLSKELPEKREYVLETYVRNVAWAKKAREVLGDYCLYNKCPNTFLRADGIPYIEVHHIIPLCKGGEDGLWNLSVLCAHHHRMAHYSEEATKLRLEQYLLKEVQCRL